MKSVYYSHCIALYGTPQEQRDLEVLFGMGFAVVNPNTSVISARCSALREQGHDTQYVMDTVFRPMVLSADVLAFRALPDGSIPAGVFQEIRWATEYARPVIELPSCVQRRGLTVDETREYLREVGHR